MSKLVRGLTATAFIYGATFAPLIAAAATDSDKAALDQATADCKAQVKTYAQYHETSWYERHKMVKSCIKDALAKK